LKEFQRYGEYIKEQVCREIGKRIYGEEVEVIAICSVPSSVKVNHLLVGERCYFSYIREQH